MVYRNLHRAYLLKVFLMQILVDHGILYIVCHCRNPCRLFVHDNVFGPLGLQPPSVK